VLLWVLHVVCKQALDAVAAHSDVKVAVVRFVAVCDAKCEMMLGALQGNQLVKSAGAEHSML
jgi:hypothetical protein